MALARFLDSAEDAIWGFMHRATHTSNGPLGEAFDHPKVVGMTCFTERMKKGISVNPCVGPMQLGRRITVTNDRNPAIAADNHLDALVFMQNLHARSVHTVFFDAPVDMHCSVTKDILSLAKRALLPAGVVLSVMKSTAWNQAGVADILPRAEMLVIHQSDGIYIVSTFTAEK
mgnify:CR=1 FL=1